MDDTEDEMLGDANEGVYMSDDEDEVEEEH